MRNWIPSPRLSGLRVLAVLLTFLGASSQALATNGHLLHGVGPINGSMGGAGVAAHNDGLGVARFNPAGLLTLERERTDVSLEYFVPERSLSSTVNAGAFGPGFPPGTFSGTTESETNAAILPAFATHWKTGENEAFQIGLQGFAGFGVEYAGSSLASPGANPVLTPQPPNGLGFGAISSEYQLMKLNLSLARRINEKLDVGFSLVPSLGRLKVNPAPFASPDDANGDGTPTYPSASHMASALGLGMQVGGTYRLTNATRVGFSYASRVKFDPFQYQALDEAGARRNFEFRMDFPSFAGIGVAHQPSSDTLFAMDIRRIFYEDTPGFSDSGYDATGRVKGFGWEDIWVVALGMEKKVRSDLRLRAGYNYGENPIPESQAFFNTPAPAIVEHHLTFGATKNLGADRELHFSYMKAFENEIAGPFVTPAGPAPGTEVRSSLAEDSISLGMSFLY